MFQSKGSNILLCLLVVILDLNAQTFTDLLRKLVDSETKTQPVQKSETFSRLPKVMITGGCSITGSISKVDSSYGSATITVLDTFGYATAQEVVWFEGGNSAQFQISGLYPGSYTLRAADNGSEITFLGNTTDLSEADWISLAPDQSGSVVISMVERSQINIDGSIINGRCFGKTVSDTIVTGLIFFEFYSSSNSRSIGNSTAPLKSDGTYSCTTGVEPGSYYVKASLLTSNYSVNNYCHQWWNGEPITLEPQLATISALESKILHFIPGGTISGNVLDEFTDTLQAGILVTAVDNKGYIISSDYIWKEESPDFKLQRLPPGDFRLVACNSIYDYTSGFYSPSYYGSVSFSGAMVLTVVEGDSLSGITITLRHNQNYTDEESSYPTTLISGTVTDWNGLPVPYASIRALSARDDGLFNAFTNQDGIYGVSVPSGTELFVSASIESPHREYFLCRKWFENTSNKSTASTVTLQENETKQIDFSLQEGGSSGGFFQHPDGTPLNDTDQYRISVYAIDDQMKNVYTFLGTELSGFRFTGMEPGTYSLHFHPSYPSIEGSLQTDFGYTSVTGIQVTAGSTASSGPISLQPASSRISGLIQQRVGIPSNMDAVFVYNSDSLLAGMSAGKIWSEDDHVLEMLPEPDIYPNQRSFSAGPLSAGSYALAHASYYDNSIVLQWSGGGSTSAGLNDDKSVIKPFIPPSAVWITISEGESVSGIDFGVSSVSMFSNRKPQLPEIKIVSGNKTAISYNLQGNFPNSRLQILNLNGKLVKSIDLHKPQGILILENHSLSIKSGAYFIRLIAGKNVVTRRQIIVKR